MVSSPTFSVIMACYNAAPYVQKAIQSVINQTFKDWELIIIDDASQDNSLSIIEAASRNDSRIRYLSNEINSGAAKARNTAIEIAKGEWLAILDADDVFLSFKLEKQFEIIRAGNPNLVLIGGGCFLIDSKGSRIKKHSYPSGSKVLKKNLQRMLNFPPHSSLVYRKSSFLDSGGFNVLFARSEDYDLWLRLSDLGDFACHPSQLIEYRLHSTNISKKVCFQSLSQVEYGISARVCQLARHANLPDPSAVRSSNAWNDFLKFVASAVKHSDYYDYNIWKNELKDDLECAKNLPNIFFVVLKYIYINPYRIFCLIQERVNGNSLPKVIYKSWLSNIEH